MVEYNSPSLNSPLLAFANKLLRTRELLDGWKGVGGGGGEFEDGLNRGKQSQKRKMTIL